MILTYLNIFPLILFNSLLSCYEEIRFDQCAKYTNVSYQSELVVTVNSQIVSSCLGISLTKKRIFSLTWRLFFLSCFQPISLAVLFE